MNKEDIKKYLTDVLKRNNLKITNQRIALYSALIIDGLPLSVEEIMKKMSKSAPSKPSIYRLLEQAVKIGLAKETHFKDGIIRYESHVHNDHNHNCCHHIVCKSCGKVDHIEVDHMEDLFKKTSKKIKNFPIVDDHTLEFFGFCLDCCKSDSKKTKTINKIKQKTKFK